MPPLDKVVHHAATEWPWTVQRHHRHQVLEHRGLQLAQQVPQTAAFKLKHALSATVREQLVSWLIVQWQLFEVELDAVIVANHGHGILQHGQGAQPQKIHLQ